LSIAGGRPDLFATATLDPIWDFALGIPRLVNVVCDNALLVGYALGRQTIDAEVIGEVVADLGRIDVPIVPVPAPVVEALPPPAAAATARPRARSHRRTSIWQ
jgi:general secretion pathway protein A